MHKNLFLLLILLSNFFIHPSHSAEDTNKKDTPSTTDITKHHYSEEDKNSLSELIENRNYESLFNLFDSIKVSPNEQITFLTNYTDSGITPIYWLLANAYSNTNLQQDSLKWLYVSIITTQQDSQICQDQTLVNMTTKFLNNYKSLKNILTVPGLNKITAQNEALFFIQNIKTRTSPKWICYFSSNDNFSTIPEENWNQKYDEIIERYTSIFQEQN